MSKYSRLFAIIKQLNSNGAQLSHKQLVKDFTGGRTESLKDLSEGEFQELERQLIKSTPKTKTATDYEADPRDAQRKAIIAQFKSINRTADDAKAWAEKYGVRGIKRLFNDYTAQELHTLLQNCLKMKSDFIKGVNKKLLNGLQ